MSKGEWYFGERYFHEWYFPEQYFPEWNFPEGYFTERIYPSGILTNVYFPSGILAISVLEETESTQSTLMIKNTLGKETHF